MEIVQKYNRDHSETMQVVRENHASQTSAVWILFVTHVQCLQALAMFRAKVCLLAYLPFNEK
jgi:hypothetical protein